MKTLFFLIGLALVVSVVVLRIRKSDAKAKLEQAESMKLRKELREKAITPPDQVEWPTIIRTVSGDGLREEEVPEPTMAAIEFEPTEHVTLQH